MLLVLLSLLSLIFTAILAGVQLTGPAFLNKMLRALEAPDYIRLKRIADAEAPKLARPLMLSALGLTLAATVTALVTGMVLVGTLLAVGFIALVVTLLAILRGDLPINQAMAHWIPDAPPADWRAVRDQWERHFAVRVASNLVALVAIAASVTVTTYVALAM